MAQVMARDELASHQRERLNVVRESGEELLHIINDILDFSKIDAGKLELESIAFDPAAVLNSAVASFAAIAERKNLRVRLHIDDSAKGMRLGDPARLRQILNNYVSNALKFTAEGGIEISVRGEGKQGRKGLTIAVQDSGGGIAPDKMPLLFQKFSQVDASTTRQFGGTGLGLAICRELAGLMGGRVWAESTPGAGSTFYVTLALAYAGEASPDQPVQARNENLADAATLRILAAEDNSTNQLVLSTIMQVMGFDLTLVGNGREAVEAWRTGAFDIILMDVQMPEMDGVEATGLIRAAEAAQGLKRTPIIALSANAFSHQVNEYLAAGMDAHVAKPIELPALAEALETAAAGLGESRDERLAAAS
jgi:two-component system, sensor histidine kinase